jgi:hypothetical protein
MVETEGCFALNIQTVPVVARGFKQGVSADDIGLDEIRRPADGAIDMRFGSEMHHRIRLMFMEDTRYFRGIADIDLLETITGIVRHRGQGLQIPRVGQLVYIDDTASGIVDELAYDSRADESGAAGDEDFVHGADFT